MEKKGIDQNAFLSELIDRYFCCTGKGILGVYGDDVFSNELMPAVSAVKVCQINNELTCDLLYVDVDENTDWEVIFGLQCELDMILFVGNGIHIPDKYFNYLDLHCVQQQLDNGRVFCFGKTFCIPESFSAPDKFKVLAIIHFFNEEDILEKTVDYLVDQGVHVHLVDNWSSDHSYEIASRVTQKYEGKVTLERFPQQKTDDYLWYQQLERTEEIAKQTDYDWYIHYDTDEIRVAPWRKVRLLDAIAFIDSLGYSCIENTVIDFRMTNSQDEIFATGSYFDFRYESIWIDQLKTWKRNERIDLKNTGGHFAKIEQPRIYPLKILNKHYPLRSFEQAERKVFHDRLPRFQKEKKERGWHTQYDNVRDAADYLYDGNKLFRWDATIEKTIGITLFTECGLMKDESNEKWNVPILEDKLVALYGAGKAGRFSYKELIKRNQIVIWVDKDYDFLPYLFGEKIHSPSELKGGEVDFVVVAVISASARREIVDYLCAQGIETGKIVFVNDVG